MIQFLCNYIKNDSIGILSNAHLAWADQEPEGIHSRRCLTIAEKISICLDFAKNGRKAYLRREERPMVYPDFMEKGSHKVSYRSDRVLGFLYRTCRSLEAAVGRLGHRHIDAGRCLALAVPGWERYRDSALAALAEYNVRLRRILNQYGISSEGEVMTCMVNTFDTYHSAQSDKLNMEDLVEKMTKFLMETTREVFFGELRAELETVDEEAERTCRMLQKASAWYMVTYASEGQPAGDSLFSFPWCVADILVQVLLSSATEQKRWCLNILSKKIDDLFKNNSNIVGGHESDDAFRNAYGIIEKWLEGEALLGQDAAGEGKPGICQECLLKVFSKFLSSHNLSWSGNKLQSNEAAITISQSERALLNGSGPKLALSTKRNSNREPLPPEYDGSGDLRQQTLSTKSNLKPNSNDSIDSTSSSEHEESSARPSWEGDLCVTLTPKPSVNPTTRMSTSEEPSAGTLVVLFLRWCLEHPDLPRETCPHGACSGGSHDAQRQTHCLPLVALRTYSSLAVSLDLCHLGLPCDPNLHEPHQEIMERDPVRIRIQNPAFHLKLKENLDDVRGLLMHWTGVQDLHIQWQDDSNSCIIVTSTGRDWQVWFLEELLLQRWLPQAIDRGSLDEFLVSQKL